MPYTETKLENIDLAKWDARFRWSAKMPVVDETENGISTIEMLARRDKAFRLAVARRQERVGRAAAFAASKWGNNHPLTAAARHALRELAPHWQRGDQPRGIQRINPIGSGGYAQ